MVVQWYWRWDKFSRNEWCSMRKRQRTLQLLMQLLLRQKAAFQLGQGPCPYCNAVVSARCDRAPGCGALAALPLAAQPPTGPMILMSNEIPTLQSVSFSSYCMQQNCCCVQSQSATLQDQGQKESMIKSISKKLRYRRHFNIGG